MSDTWDDAADRERDIIRHMVDSNEFFSPISQLNSETVDEFINSFKRVAFERGEVVCRQKEVGTEVYVIESGKFDIYTTRRKEDGKTIEEFLVATIGGGADFGMMEYQYDTPRLGTVMVSDDTEEATCWMVDGESLAKFIQSNPLLSKRLRIGRLLYATLSDTSLLNNIDEPNIKADLINTFALETIAAGDTIIKQGDEVDDDSKLYVLLEGEAEAYVEKPFAPTLHSDSYRTGDNFGDLSFLYDCPRDSSVVATTDCSLLTLKKSQFEELAAKGASTLRNLFDKFAIHRSRATAGGAEEAYMSANQFVDALIEYVMGNESIVASDWEDKLALIRDFAHPSSYGDLVSFSEFIKRTNLMGRSDPEVEIAFRLFDQDSTGTVETQNFRNVLIQLLTPDYCPFDLQAAVPTNFFPASQILESPTFKEWLQPRVVKGKKSWRHNRNVQTLSQGVEESYEETAHFFRRMSTEDMLNDDGLMATRSNPHGYSPFPWSYLFAGAVAGAVSRTAVYPLTRLKILLQTGILSNVKSFGSVLSPAGAFQGNAANVMRAVPHMATQFFVYDYLTKMRLESSSSPILSVPERFVCGGIAGSIALSLTFPLDVAQARMTVMTSAQKEFNWSTVETLVTLAKKEGFSSFFKGYIPAMASVFPWVGTEFATYEVAKSVLGLDPIVAGAVAGTTATAVVYPLELIRRRMQVQGFAAKTTYNYSGFMQGISSIMSKQGIAGLYKGFLPNLVRVVPAVGISFATYEVALDWWREKLDDHRFERNYEYPHEEHGGH